MMFRFGGVEFGGRTGPLIVTDFDPGSAALVVNDHQRPNRDGVMSGRDYLGGRTWAFDISTNRRDVLGALESSGALEAAWKNRKVRLRPNVNVPLSYEVGGRWRRVYGRPNNYAGPKGDVLAERGVGRIVADFRVNDPLHYDEAETVVVLTIVPAAAGGLRTPLVAPLSTVRSSAPRVGLVDNTGDGETPLKVTFHGPVVNPWVRAAAGWEIGLTGTLAYDVSVTVDAMAGTVKRSDGASVAGMLTRKTRLSSAVLPVGRSDVTFGGADITGTATATLAWRNAYQSI
jgi:hypothetical protein